MRKFLMAVAIVGVVLLVAAPAMALDFKFGSEYRIRFYDYSNAGFDSNNFLNPQMGSSTQQGSASNRGNPGGVQIRVRPRFDVSDDNGNIQATIRFEYGDTTFGGGGGANGSSQGSNTGGTSLAPSGNRTGNGAGGSIGADGVALETKWAYVDFAMPMNIPLRWRVGVQPWYLPKGLIIDDDATGVRAYGSYGIVSYDASWWRIALPSASPGATAGLIGKPRLDDTKDDNFDFFEAKLDFNIAPWLQAGAYYLYGANEANCANPYGPQRPVFQAGGMFITPQCDFDRHRDQNWLGLTFTGKVATVDYDLDFVYGSAKGGDTGTFSNPNTVLPVRAGVINASVDPTLKPEYVNGFAIDGGVHIPIGPVKLNLLGTYASGDKAKGPGHSSGAFPYGPGPSWSGAGGQYELIGEGGAFDVVNMTQHSPTDLWMLGATVEYVPVKALWLKLAYGFAGFSQKSGNCAVYMTPVVGGGLVPNNNTQCYGPIYYGKVDTTEIAGVKVPNGAQNSTIAGQSYLGQEVHLRADYTMWTGFKVQGMVGWLFPSKGDVAGKYILQLLYNF